MSGTAIDHVLAFLIPIFLTGADGDHAAARRAAAELLESHGAATLQEALLSAEIIAQTFATLDSLGKSIGDPQMPLSTRLRLRSNANALSRAAERGRQALERLQSRKTGTSLAAPASPSVPAAVRKVPDAIVEAAPSLAETLTKPDQPLSRQQRRFLTRKAEQARAAQQRDAWKASRLAGRAAMPAPDQAKTSTAVPQADLKANPEAAQSLPGARQ